MSKKSFAKSSTDVYVGLMADYNRIHGVAPRIEDVVDWAVANGLVDKPRVDLRKILIKTFRQAARSARKRDARGRRVREVVPATIEKFDENGNRILCEVVWDWLHDMSLDHALVTFSQRDTRITNQRYSATRDLESALEFNPNLAGQDDQFKFDFMLHEPVEQTEERLEETKAVLPQDQQMPEDRWGGPQKPR